MLMTAADILLLCAAAIGSGSMVGVGMWLYFRVKRLEGENRDLRQLTGQVEELRGQMETARDDIGEIFERMEFTERVLTKGRGSTRDSPLP